LQTRVSSVAGWEVDGSVSVSAGTHYGGGVVGKAGGADSKDHERRGTALLTRSARVQTHAALTVHRRRFAYINARTTSS